MDDTINRRAFLRLSATAGALAATGLPTGDAQAATPRPYTPVAGRQLDSQEFCLSEYDSITPSLGFSATDADAARRWQTEARARLVDLLGGFPERVPLQAEVLEWQLPHVDEGGCAGASGFAWPDERGGNGAGTPFEL